MSVIPTNFDDTIADLMSDIEPFAPVAHYDADGDCIEFFAKSEPFIAERIDDLVTVYVSRDNAEVIGSLIKGVSAFCENILARMPGFAIEINDGKVRLEHLFLAKMWSEADSIQVITYKKLIAMAEESNAEANFSLSV